VSAGCGTEMQNATANSAGGTLAPDMSIAAFDDLACSAARGINLHENSETAGYRAHYDWRTTSQ